MSEFEIKRAERQQARLRLAFQGPSGSGKTATSLLVAKGIIEGMVESGELVASQNPRIGLIDTERRSAQLYSHIVPFDTIELGPPFSTARYIGALRALENAGYPVIIIDQISHEWAGQGGVLQAVDAAQSRGGNQMAAWIDATPMHDEFVDAMLRVNAHLIVTMRSKTSWQIVEETDSRGRLKKVPKRIGMAPVQRPGIEYEFTTLLALDTDANKAVVLKDRTIPKVFGEINAVLDRLGEQSGRQLVAWMKGGAAMADPTFGSGTPAQQAVAKADAAVRNCEAARTLPDLARLYETSMKDLMDYRGKIPDQDLKTLRDRVISAKDAAKASLGGSLAKVDVSAHPEDAISADAVIVLGEMLTTAGILRDDFLVEFQLKTVAGLTVSRWEAAQKWIVATAGVNGLELTSRTYPAEPLPPPADPTPVEKVLDFIDRTASREAGGSLFDKQVAGPANVFADFEDDIPL